MLKRHRKFFEYLNILKKQLKDIENKIQKHPSLDKLFNQINWFNKVESQIKIWEQKPESYSKKRLIDVSEYELFRYFTEDYILKNFINAFLLIENNLKANNTNQLNHWNSTKSLLFSEDVSQIYSSLFEIFMLGKIISTKKRINIYYENIDGRLSIDSRYIYFEIKSLQKSAHDLEGIGAVSTEHDKNQIYRALRGKNRQLFRYRKFPTVIFLSLYRLADRITGSWYIPEYFSESIIQLKVDNKIVSGVKLYSWFTCEGVGAFYINKNSVNKLTKKEIEFLYNL